MSLAPVVKIAAVVLLLGGSVTFLLFGSQASDAFIYSKLVDEVVSRPQEYTGRQLRVEGDLQPGSVTFRSQPCEWRFVLTKANQQMSVQYPKCVMPDTFRDGVGIVVTVQGYIQENGWFMANQVIPRCPSKYEMETQNQNGVDTPHR